MLKRLPGLVIGQEIPRSSARIFTPQIKSSSAALSK